MNHKYFGLFETFTHTAKSQSQLTKVVGGSETSHLHVLLIVGAALQNGGYTLHTEHRGGDEKRCSRSEQEDEGRRRDSAES